MGNGREQKKRTKKIWKSGSAVALAALLGLSTAAPVFADVTFHLTNADGSTSTKTFEGDTYGDAVNVDISVRDTYYDKDTQKDYDLDTSVKNSPMTGDTIADDGTKSNADFYYVEHTDQPLTVTVYQVVLSADGNTRTVLGSKEYTLAPSGQESSDGSTNGTLEVTADAEVIVGEDTYKLTSTAKATFNYDSTDSLQHDFVYTLQGTEAETYEVTVNYVTTEGEALATRSFYSEGKEHIYYAPSVFSSNKTGTTVYYSAVDSEENPTRIVHDPDSTVREYNVAYEEQVDQAYTWYIMVYNSETNTCISVEKETVQPGETATFTPKKIDGFTINAASDHEWTHTYGDTNRTSYIYYDPENYDTTVAKTRDVEVQYVNIANASVLKSETVTVSSDQDSAISLPESFDQNGVHYLRVAGQVETIITSYYSPKTRFTAYYYDEANTQFETAVIYTEVVEEVEVWDGTTTYTVVPGVTRTIVVNTGNGATNVIDAQDATGAPITNNANTNNANTNTDNTTTADDVNTPQGNVEAGDGDTSESAADVSIDGVRANEIETPEGSIILDSVTDLPSSGLSRKTVFIMGLGIAGGILLIILIVDLYIRRSREKNRRNRR